MSAFFRKIWTKAFYSPRANVVTGVFLNGVKSSLMQKSGLNRAIKARAGYVNVKETAGILRNAPLMASLRRSEQDLQNGKVAKVTSSKCLDRFFRG